MSDYKNSKRAQKKSGLDKRETQNEKAKYGPRSARWRLSRTWRKCR